MAGLDLRTAWRVPLVIVMCAATAVGGYALTWKVRDPVRETAIAGIAVPEPLVAATGTPAHTPSTSAPVPTAAGVARAITAALHDPALGSRLLVRVSDAQ